MGTTSRRSQPLYAKQPNFASNIVSSGSREEPHVLCSSALIIRQHASINLAPITTRFGGLGGWWCGGGVYPLCECVCVWRWLMWSPSSPSNRNVCAFRISHYASARRANSLSSAPLFVWQNRQATASLTAFKIAAVVWRRQRRRGGFNFSL